VSKHKDWQTRHGEIIRSFIEYMNEQSVNYILKGGTALYVCYGLDRFSEDIDLDSTDKTTIEKIVAGFCKKEKFSYRTAKDTETVKRYMINYGNVSRPIKVETSFRKKEIMPAETTKINNIMVYTIEPLCLMKTNAYLNRDKIRDLYDLAFICNRYWDTLSTQTKFVIRNAVEHKGIEQFDYIIKTQQDDLIDTKKLSADFLEMYDKLGLLCDETEQKIVEETIQKKPKTNTASDLAIPLKNRPPRL